MYFVFSVLHNETGRYYSELGDALADAVETAVVLARATHSNAQTVVQTCSGPADISQVAPKLLWEVNAYKPRDAGGYPAITVVNLF